MSYFEDGQIKSGLKNKNDRIYTQEMLDRLVDICNQNKSIANGFNVTNTGTSINIGPDDNWVVPNPWIQPVSPPPFTVGAGTSHPHPYPPTLFPTNISPEKDTDGATVIKQSVPSMSDILVEIGRIIAKNGDILEIRELLQKHKIKLIDHDGEVIFDPAWRKTLKSKDF